VKAKNIFLTCALALGSLFGQAQGLQGVVVERYYTANSADAADATAQGAVVPLVANQSTTFRVYIDLAPGYKFVQLFGRPAEGAAPANPLTVSSSANFYNDPNFGVDLDAGNISSTNINKRTALIDSYFTTGLVSASRVGVREADDSDGALTNQQGLLANTVACLNAGITGASGKDGLMPSSASTGVATNGLGLGAGNSALSALAGVTPGSSITINDGAIAALGGIVGTTADNVVLIGQFTTSGNLVFSLNIQVVNIATGVAEVYVASNPRAGEQVFSTLAQTTSAGSCAPVVSNDSPAGATSVGFNVNMSYPGSDPINGTTTNATNSSESGDIAGADTWVRFVAQGTGASISMSSSVMNCIISLYSKDALGFYNLIQTENAVGGNSPDNERLNVGGLTPGTEYWVAFGSNTGSGNYVYSIQHLLRSYPAYPITAAGFQLCNPYKCVFRGNASSNVSYTFNFIETGGTEIAPFETTSASTTSTYVTLSTGSLALQYGGLYDVRVDVLYNLRDANNVVEPISVVGTTSDPNSANVLMSNHPLLEVKNTQRCPASLFRGTYLSGTRVGGAPAVCGATNYTYEFQQVATCNDGTAIGATTSFQTPSSSPYLQLGVLPTGVNAGSWDVRIRPNFSYGAGTFGPVQRIRVNGTSASGMQSDDTAEIEFINPSEIESNVFPNPTFGDMIHLNVAGMEGNVSLRISDATGRLVLNQNYVVEGTLNTNVTFNEVLSSGVYNIELNNGQHVVTERMIVRN